MSVSVIIPVFNAFPEALACLQSVREHSEGIARVYVIDDCSTEGLFSKFLPDEIKSDSFFEVTRNTENLGFVKSCNAGMRAAGTTDVILLNSDTLVTTDWAVKLREATYSKPEVGTVTPFTNNGNICSLPNFLEANEIPSGYSLKEMALLVERVSERSYPILPTAVGFCMFIKRKVLDDIGLFDEKNFGKGYGEENDFSLRAVKAGYINILDDATYVFHKGSSSFIKSGEFYGSQSYKAVRKKYPRYFTEVSEFQKNNPLKDLQDRVVDEMLVRQSADTKTCVLHMLHDGPFVGRNAPIGGTERHVQDLILHCREALHWSLVCHSGAYYLTAHLPDCKREFVIDAAKVPVEALVSSRYFDLVHLHHTQGFDYRNLTDALVAHGNFMVSFHDYISVCPRTNMLTPGGKVCNGHECVETCGYSSSFVSEYRDCARDLVANAKELVCFSESTRELLANVFGEMKELKIIEHGSLRDAGKVPRIGVRSAQKPFKVAFIGHLTRQKGAKLIAKLVKESELASGCPVEWHYLGNSSPGGWVVDHGPYERRNLTEKLEAVSPHLVAILSHCPETFSLILSEAWDAGIPALVSPHGAPAERVRLTGAGWVLKDLEYSTVMQALEDISGDAETYRLVLKKVSVVKPVSVGEMAECYTGLYAAHAENLKSGVSIKTMLAELSQLEGLYPAQCGLGKRIRRSVVRGGLNLLDTARLRGPIQDTLYRFASPTMLDRFRSLRK